MSEIENSEVIQHIIQTLINISSRKTTRGQAINTMADLVNKLKKKHFFLKHVEIKDTRFLELDDPVSVMSDIDNVKSNDVGKALYDIIKNMHIELGRKAGHFFIKELRNNINDEYNILIEEMGLDLGLMQLEFEISEMSKKL